MCLIDFIRLGWCNLRTDGQHMCWNRNLELVSRQLEKELKDTREREYVNPELALAEKNKGNDLFKAGDFPAAIKVSGHAERHDTATRHNLCVCSAGIWGGDPTQPHRPGAVQ